VTEAKKRTDLEKQTLAAKAFLGNTGLMFKGFYEGEYGNGTDII
jgi:hypothetical protein